MTDLARDVLMIEDLVTEMTNTIPDVGDAEALIIAAHRLETVVMLALNNMRRDLASAAGDLMGTYQREVPGVGVVARHSLDSYKEYKHEDLNRAVMDSVLVDKSTGEITPETEAEKLRAVWGAQKDPAHPLPGYQASKSALKARGIDIKDFCRVEPREGWKLEFRSGKAE